MNLCSSFRIKCLLYYTSYEVINITNANINQSDVPDNVSQIFLEEYYKNDEQIESVSDLTKLRNFEIKNKGQEFIPTFKNVPYLFEVLITGEFFSINFSTVVFTLNSCLNYVNNNLHCIFVQ